MGAAPLFSAWSREVAITMLWTVSKPLLGLVTSAGPMAALKAMSRGTAMTKRWLQLQSPPALRLD